MKITEFLKHNYRHFNAAALIDAAEGYKTHLEEGGKMMVTLAGAMSTAEMGISLAEMKLFLTHSIPLQNLLHLEQQMILLLSSQHCHHLLAPQRLP